MKDRNPSAFNHPLIKGDFFISKISFMELKIYKLVKLGPLLKNTVFKIGVFRGTNQSQGKFWQQKKRDNFVPLNSFATFWIKSRDKLLIYPRSNTMQNQTW